MKSSRSLIITLGGALAAAAAWAAPVRVLVVTGQHGYNKPEFNAMFASFEGIAYTIKETQGDPGALFDSVEDFPYDVVALYNFKQSMNETQKANFLKLFERGVGLVSMHHAIAGFPDWVAYEKLIGATYVLKAQRRDGREYAVPTWKHGVDMNIRVEDREHPITRGVTDFTIHDETYKGWVYHGSGHLLLSTDHELSNPQIAWTVPHPNANIFFIQLGHDQHAFRNENYRKLISQGIHWAAAKNRKNGF